MAGHVEAVVENPVHEAAVGDEEVAEEQRDDDPARHDRQVVERAEERARRHPGVEQHRRREAEHDLRGDGDRHVEAGVLEGAPEDGVVERASVVAEADELARGAGDDRPVVEADLEGARDRVEDDEGEEQEPRREEQVRRRDVLALAQRERPRPRAQRRGAAPESLGRRTTGGERQSAVRRSSVPAGRTRRP